MGIPIDRLGPHARAQAEAQLGTQAKSGGRIRAKPITVDGIRFRSRLEARVYVRVRDELEPDEKLVIDCRFPLIAVAPRIGKASKAGYIEIDFTVWRSRGEVMFRLERAYDAKPKNAAARSRDWRRGARAFAATYGIEIEEVDQ